MIGACLRFNTTAILSKSLRVRIMAELGLNNDYWDSTLPDRTAELASPKRVALLLAGGDGMRLQELTRAIAGVPIPKQYCRLLRGISLLEATLSRAQLFTAKEHISVIINRNHMDLAREQLRAVAESNIFVQPLNLDTGPGMLFSLINLERLYGDAIVAVFPTDHYIDSDRAFMAHVQHATHAISHMPDKVVVLGVVPDRPETGYGYILPADPLKAIDGAYRVEAFTEKPSFNVATDIISRGGLWNTFVMIFRLSRMLELIREFVPLEFERLSELPESPEKADDLYQDLDSWNLSTNFLARIPQHLIMLRVADVRWSDWGTRESVERTYRSLNLVPFWNLSNPVSNPAPS
jgi:mannose-1-phosphate guanylyltransferase